MDNQKKWVAVGGGWRKTNEKVEEDVRKTVREIITQGNGIISGGALGVDYIATDEAIKNNCDFKQLKIIIPSSLDVYSKHYLSRSREEVITEKQAESLIKQLRQVESLGALVEGESAVLDKEAYFKRVERVIENADELVAFHINGTEGTQYTIDKAREKGIPVKVFNYEIE